MSNVEASTGSAPPERSGWRRNGWDRYLVATGVYLVAIVLCFHGIIAHPGSRITGIGDGTGTLRDLWAAGEQHRNPFTFSHDSLIAAPEGFPRPPATALANGAIQTAFVWGLRSVLGLIGAWNAFMFIGLFGTALAMFAFLNRLGCTPLASTLGGYVLGFGPYALERAYAGHLALLQNWVFVLLAATLLRLREQRSLRAAAVAGIVVGIAFYLSAYQGLLAGFATLVLLAIDAARGWRWRTALSTLRLAFVTYAVTLIALTPILIAYLRERSAVDAGTSHGSADLYQFAATLGAYFLPSPRNPLFHWLRGIHPADLTEETLFVGYLTLGLAVFAIVLLLRRNEWLFASPRRVSAAVFFSILAPCAFVMSLPPSYSVASIRIPMPSRTVGLLSGIWRVYSRFGLLFGFAAVGLAALGLSALSQRRFRGSRFVAPLVCLIVVLEIFPGNLSPLDTAFGAQPAWVKWLAARPSGLVASYPWIFGVTQDSDDWYQIFDRDPLFDFPRELSTSEQSGRAMGIRLLARDVGDPLAASVLSTEGVRYVVVHDDAYRSAGQTPPTLPPSAYTLLARLGDVRIFSVHAQHANIADELRQNASELALLQGLTPSGVSYGQGFNAPEMFQGLVSRWMEQDGQLTLNADAAVTVTLSGVAFSNGVPRRLRLESASGHLLGRVLVPTYATGFHLGPFRIPAGSTTLRLVATPGPQVLSPADPRAASVFLEPLTVAAIPPYVSSGSASASSSP